jgi:adenine-specific DNA methylase
MASRRRTVGTRWVPESLKVVEELEKQGCKINWAE